MNKYIYDGSVMIFDTIVERNWYGETMAVSKTKARSNLTYQYKREHGLMPRTRVSLPDEVIMILEMEGWENDE